jgi:hypothetical protein
VYTQQRRQQRKQTVPHSPRRKQTEPNLLLLGNNEVNDDGDDGEDDEDEESQAVRLERRHSSKNPTKRRKHINPDASALSHPKKQAPSKQTKHSSLFWLSSHGHRFHACHILTCMQNFLRNLTALLWNWCPCRSSTAALSSIVSNFSPRSNVMWIF